MTLRATTIEGQHVARIFDNLGRGKFGSTRIDITEIWEVEGCVASLEQRLRDALAAFHPDLVLPTTPSRPMIL